MINVIVKRRGNDVWDGELSCLPLVGHRMTITDDGEETTYTVAEVAHDINYRRRLEDHHIVYIYVK